MKKRKSIFKYALFLFLIGLGSCEEEARGPLTSDGTVPGAVSQISVTNLPGGARIAYSVPSDEDALLVEASYIRNDEEVTARSSIFKNFVLIEGLKETTPQEVKLVAVDRSDNRSEPVTVNITPERAPIDGLFESFELVPAFGGVRLKYNNENEIKAEISLFTIDQSGHPAYEQSAFINDSLRTSFTYRGFPPETQKYGVVAVDRWDNSTTMFTEEVLPIREVLFDRFKHEGIELTGDEPSAFGWVLPLLFNGVPTGFGFHTSQITDGSILAPYTEPHHAFSVDLGVLAKLSRFKFWPRQGDCCATPYGHGDPRFYELWGIDELPDDNGASLEGWTRLIENGEIIKPSGAPLGTHSAEDIAYAASGWEAEISLDAPPVRYIRFVNIENWSGTSFMHLTELEFYGQEK